MNGREKRIKLVKAPTPEDQAKHIKGADLVIWAGGYETNCIPIKDHQGNEIPLQQAQPGVAFDVDKKCRICTADGAVLTKCFGMGIGYSTRTNDSGQTDAFKIANQDNEKANISLRSDSFGLYAGRVADLVLMSLLQPSILNSTNQK